jgi:DNA-binding MarR family transcriptional regulator
MTGLENKTNSELRYIIRYTDKKNEAWEQLLKQSPTNSDLVYIIEYTDKKNEAWEQLLKQSPTNSDLVYIIRYTDKKNEAWEQLLKQSPTNSDLVYIVKNIDGECKVRDEAIFKLRTDLKVPTDFNEESLINEIASIVVSSPDKLKMDQWNCGTSHCLAGWACVLDKDIQKAEQSCTSSDFSKTEIAGVAALPNYSNLFYENDVTVLNFLKKKLGV